MVGLLGGVLSISEDYRYHISVCPSAKVAMILCPTNFRDLTPHRLDILCWRVGREAGTEHYILCFNPLFEQQLLFFLSSARGSHFFVT